jgi:hypothetical protein
MVSNGLKEVLDMLNIILGEKNQDIFLNCRKFVDYNDGLFNDIYEEAWFDDNFVKKIMNEIDHIDLEKSKGTALTNYITGNTHSHRELSTGCKTLILIYKYPNVIFQARFGDNCTDILEQLAVNNDITIKSDYLHFFNFKYISEINYINYDYIAKSKDDIYGLLQAFRDDNADPFDEEKEDEMTIEELEKIHPFLAAEINETMRKSRVNP